MMLQIFSVRDQAAGAFLPPFFMRSRGEAIRAFSEAVGDPQHQFAKHVSDFTLFCIGDFDDNSGMIRPVEPVRIISGFECFGPDQVTVPARTVDGRELNGRNG